MQLNAFLTDTKFEFVSELEVHTTVHLTALPGSAGDVKHKGSLCLIFVNNQHKAGGFKISKHRSKFNKQPNGNNENRRQVIILRNELICCCVFSKFFADGLPQNVF